VKIICVGHTSICAGSILIFLIGSHFSRLNHVKAQLFYVILRFSQSNSHCCRSNLHCFTFFVGFAQDKILQKSSNFGRDISYQSTVSGNTILGLQQAKRRPKREPNWYPKLKVSPIGKLRGIIIGIVHIH
jgi:hypothetical protein